MEWGYGGFAGGEGLFAGNSAKSVVYKYYRVEEQGTKRRKSKVTCVLCKQTRCGEYERMLEHLCTKCNSRYRIPLEDKEMIRKQYEYKRRRRERLTGIPIDELTLRELKPSVDSQPPLSPAEVMAASSDPSSSQAAMIFQQQQSAASSGQSRNDPSQFYQSNARAIDELTEMQKLLAEFVLAFNLPTQMTESEFFKFFVLSLSSNKLKIMPELLNRNSCLNLLHNDIRSIVHGQIQNAKSLSLLLIKRPASDTGFFIVYMDAVNEHGTRIPINQVVCQAPDFNATAVVKSLLVQFQCFEYQNPLASIVINDRCLEAPASTLFSEISCFRVECFLTHISDLFLSLFIEKTEALVNPLHNHLIRALKVFTYFYDSLDTDLFENSLNTICSIYYTFDRYRSEMCVGYYDKQAPWDPEVLAITQDSSFWSDQQNILQILLFYQHLRQTLLGNDLLVSDCFLVYLIVGHFLLHASPLSSYRFPYSDIFEHYFQHFVFSNNYLYLVSYFLDNRFKGFQSGLSIAQVRSCFQVYFQPSAGGADLDLGSPLNPVPPESVVVNDSSNILDPASDCFTSTQGVPGGSLNMMISSADCKTVSARPLPPLPLASPSTASVSQRPVQASESREFSDLWKFVQRFLSDPCSPTSPLFYWSSVIPHSSIPFHQSILTMYQVKPLIPLPKDIKLIGFDDEFDRERKWINSHFLRFYLDLKYPICSSRPVVPKPSFFQLTTLSNSSLCRCYRSSQLEQLSLRLCTRSLVIDLDRPIQELTRSLTDAVKNLTNVADPPVLVPILLRQTVVPPPFSAQTTPAPQLKSSVPFASQSPSLPAASLSPSFSPHLSAPASQIPQEVRDSCPQESSIAVPIQTSNGRPSMYDSV